MQSQGNVSEFDKQIIEALAAVLKAVSPLILEMTTEQIQTYVIGNSDLQDNLRAGLALLPKPVVKEPTLVLVKQTMPGSTSVTTYGLGKQLRIADMLRAFVTFDSDTSLVKVEEHLKEHKHFTPSAQAEEMLDKQSKFFRKEEGGKHFGLRGDGRTNLILVQNADGSLSVVSARWRVGGWRRSGYSLDDGRVWDAGLLLVLSNSSDTSNV